MTPYFDDYKGVLCCMEAFYRNSEQTETERYAAALMQLLDVMRNIQDVACDQHNDETLDQFDYVEVKDWLLCDWIRLFPDADEELWKKLNTHDYAVWGFDSPEAYWEKIMNLCSSKEVEEG